jgi:hypothetical protein
MAHRAVGQAPVASRRVAGANATQRVAANPVAIVVVMFAANVASRASTIAAAAAKQQPFSGTTKDPGMNTD